MKAKINLKDKNVVACNCLTVFQYDDCDDFVFCKTDDSGEYYDFGVICPHCGCFHRINKIHLSGRHSVTVCSRTSKSETCEGV